MIKRSVLKKLAWLLFALYLVGLLYFTIFAESMGRGGRDIADSPKYNLILFNEISRFIKYREQLGLKAVVINIAGNFAAFVPGGMLLPMIHQKFRRAVFCIPAGFLISFFIECTQVVFRIGSFDVDDLVLNTLGAAFGYVLYVLIAYIKKCAGKKKTDREVKIRRIG